MGLFRKETQQQTTWEVPVPGKDPNGVSLSEQYIREMKSDWDTGRRRYDSLEGVPVPERGVYGCARKGEKPVPPQWLGSSRG